MKTLTVKELIQELNKCPKDLKVFISSDTEGNSFGTIDSYEKSFELGTNTLRIYPYEEHIEYDEIDDEENPNLGKI